MKYALKKGTLFIGVTFLASCAATSTVQEIPATVELAPMELPLSTPSRIHQMDKMNGEERFYEIINFQADGTFTGRTSDGCSWEDSGDPVSPAASWSDCGNNPDWSKGENRKLTKKGEIWPLEVGNAATYEFVQVNAHGESQGKTARKCKVLSQVNIDVAVGNVDAYKVRCIRKQGDWSRTTFWYFSPEYSAAVKYVNRTSGNGLEDDHEMVRIESL